MENFGRRVDAIVGLQWGSEGKGKFAALIANDYDVAVRSGGPNAGHTLIHKGKKVVCHMVPCSFVNPNTYLVISAGAVVDPVKLDKEISDLEEITGLEIRKRLVVDKNAAVILDSDYEDESGLQYMGSTRQGVGSAIVRKISRKHVIQARTIGEYVSITGFNKFTVINTVHLLHEQYRNGKKILLEGTQGAGLSLNHGTYPYVTSKDVTTAALLADAGLPPSSLGTVYGVVRTYPIRVGGPSGPMGTEISWEEVAKRGNLSSVPTEITTVTKRIRRVALPNYAESRYFADMNGVTHLCIAFADYLDGRLQGTEWSNGMDIMDLERKFPNVMKEIDMWTSTVGRPVDMISYGPTPEQTIFLD